MIGCLRSRLPSAIFGCLVPPRWRMFSRVRIRLINPPHPISTKCCVRPLHFAVEQSDRAVQRIPRSLVKPLKWRRSWRNCTWSLLQAGFATGGSCCKPTRHIKRRSCDPWQQLRAMQNALVSMTEVLADEIRAYLREIGEVSLQEARSFEVELEKLGAEMASGGETAENSPEYRRRWKAKP